MNGVLTGVRVLDFGRHIAGPYCATLLADMGAEVIRIERVDGSEDRFVLPVGEGDTGAGFLQIARNKLGLTLNPMKPEGREIVKKLVATADVVVANLPLPSLVQMGIDYDSLKAIKPDIVLTMISAFGIDGPYAERVGFDLLGQAMSGSMHLSGPEETPTRSQTPWVDYGTAVSAAFGTMGALLERNRSGQGQLVEASLFSTALAFNAALLIDQAVISSNRVGRGNLGINSAPNDAYRTKDGWIVLMIVGQPIYERWATLMGESKWLDDPRFATDQSRADHGEEISARMNEWCATRTNGEAMAALEAARIPAGPVYAPQETLEDPHANARGLYTPLEYPGVPRPAPLVDTPVRLSGNAVGIRHRAPTLGEHTDRVLAELGYSAEEIAAFRKGRIV